MGKLKSGSLTEIPYPSSPAWTLPDISSLKTSTARAMLTGVTTAVGGRLLEKLAILTLSPMTPGEDSSSH